MALLSDFARAFLEDGAVRLDKPPTPDAKTAEVLERAWRRYALELPGPPVPFCRDTARRAIEVAGWACWFLVSRDDPPDEVTKRLVLETGCPASADLVLLRLQYVLRRARLIGTQDALARGLESLLRRWPLSGVLADISAGPVCPVELGGHPGLLLLYAERLASQPRPAWAVSGPAWLYIELVFGQRGLVLPAPSEPCRE
jgi:hypothetical protein